MALLVIGLLVLGYTNLSSLEQQKEDSEGELTALEYMRNLNNLIELYMVVNFYL